MNRIYKHLKRRHQIHKLALYRNILRSLIKNTRLSKNLRITAHYKLTTLPSYYSFTKINNLCIFTQRTRGVYRKFRISRIMLRQFADYGLIPGLLKSSF